MAQQNCSLRNFKERCLQKSFNARCLSHNFNFITCAENTLDKSRLIAYSGGGTYEHFDLGRLESVLQNIQNDDYYPTFDDKLTHLFFCVCEFHCFADGNKRLAITLSAQFLLFNGYMAVAKSFFTVMENISYQVAAGKIDKDLLHRIIIAVMDGTYETDEELKLDIIHAIN